MADGPSAARRKVSTGLAAIALCGLLTSCAAFKQKDVLNEDGLNPKNSDKGSFAGFRVRYERLQVASKADTVTAADAKALVKTGTNIAYQLCSSFFKTAGLEQQQLLFSRDVVGLVGTVVTGVLGATNAGAAATGWLGLGSGAALSGISIYSRNFLFSEDNVQAVQNLVLTAMSEATDKALDRSDYDFDTAVTAIMDVQSVCEVQHILSLVRQSINTAQPTATSFDGRRINVNVLARTDDQRIIRGVPSTPAGVWLRTYVSARGEAAEEQKRRRQEVERITSDLISSGLKLEQANATTIVNDNSVSGLDRIEKISAELRKRLGL